MTPSGVWRQRHADSAPCHPGHCGDTRRALPASPAALSCALQAAAGTALEAGWPSAGNLARASILRLGPRLVRHYAIRVRDTRGFGGGGWATTGWQDRRRADPAGTHVGWLVDLHEYEAGHPPCDGRTPVAARAGAWGQGLSLRAHCRGPDRRNGTATLVAAGGLP